MSTRNGLRPLIFIYHRGSQLPDEVIAFGQEGVDASLAFRDIWTNIEFAVDAHVID
jgi:hypothetical protein